MTYVPNETSPANVLDAAIVQMNYQKNLKTALSSKPLKQYNNIANSLRIICQQQHNNRFIWRNLPNGVDSQLVERMLWYRYQLMFFYDENRKKFEILPFTMCAKTGDQIDFYGRYNYVMPISFNGKSLQTNETGKTAYLSSLNKKVCHDIPFVQSEEDALKVAKESAVLIFDYTSQVAQFAVPQAVLQQSFVEAETEILKLTRRVLLNSSSMKWIRFKSEADADSFNELQDAYNRTITDTDKQFVGFSSDLDVQESGNQNPADITSFWAAFEALDNLRLKTLGITNDGSIQKKAHMLQAEMDMGNISTQFPLLDAWAQRIKACAIINAIWDLGITCELNMGETGGQEEQTEENNNENIDMGDNPEGGEDGNS